MRFIENCDPCRRRHPWLVNRAPNNIYGYWTSVFRWDSPTPWPILHLVTRKICLLDLCAKVIRRLNRRSDNTYKHEYQRQRWWSKFSFKMLHQNFMIKIDWFCSLFAHCASIFLCMAFMSCHVISINVNCIILNKDFTLWLIANISTDLQCRTFVTDTAKISQ